MSKMHYFSDKVSKIFKRWPQRQKSKIQKS